MGALLRLNGRLAVSGWMPALTLVAVLSVGVARAGVPDVLQTAYPDPQQRSKDAETAAAAGGTLQVWALAEAQIGVHRFADSDRSFARAARLAVADPALELADVDRLAYRLEQRMLLDEAIEVRGHLVARRTADLPAAGIRTRDERNREAQAVEDLKRIADLQRRQLRWAEFYAARERVLDVATDSRRSSELAEYLDLLLSMDRTDRALEVARQYVELTGDAEVLRQAIQVMIREKQPREAHRLLRLAVASSMEYWDFRYLLVEYMEAFEPGVRWASDRDERLRSLMLGKPLEAVDYLLLGSAYQVVGERKAEEQAYRSYLNTGGVSAPKLRTVGDLMFGMGKTAEAFLLYQRYLAEYPDGEQEAEVLLRIVDCLERTYDLETSFHGAFNAFGYLFLDERTPQLSVGVLSVLYNDVPLDDRLDGLEDALDRYYVDLLALDLLWNLTRRHPDSPEAHRAYHRLLDYYRRYDDGDRQLQVCELFIDRYPDSVDANEFRFEKAAILNGRGEYGAEEQIYREAFEATFPPPGAPRPYEPVDVDEVRRTTQHDRAFRSLLSIYERDTVARFYDEVALYKVEIDLRGGDMELVEQLVRVCDQHNAYGEIEALYQEVIRTYDTMGAYDKLARHYLRMRQEREAEQVYKTARKRFSDRSEPYAWLHGYYHDQQQYDQATQVLRGAISAFPDDLDWYFTLASTAYDQGGQSARCAVYEEALTHFEHEWRFVEGLANCESDLQTKLALLEREQAVVPEARTWMLAQYGKNYLVIDRIEQAEQALGQAPDDPVLHRYLGDLYHGISHFEQALEHYEIAARTMTDDGRLLERVGDLQRSLGRLDDAGRTFAVLAQMRREGWAGYHPEDQIGGAVSTGRRVAAVATASDEAFWVTLGEVRAEAGDADGALQAWRHVIDADRADPETWLEVASACWDYFLFDEAVAVFEEERRVLGDDQLHAKQLAAVYESKRDYRHAIDEYVRILGQGDPYVREDVRIRLVYLARNKGLDHNIRKTFERAIRAEPGHEGLYRNYADHCARLEDWPAVYAIYDDARDNVRDRRFLEWVAGEFERLGQADRAEEAFADLARTYASDVSAWRSYLDYISRRYAGAERDEARTAVLISAHWALPTAGFHHELLPLLAARGDTRAMDKALRVRADALDGAERFAALTDLARQRVGSGAFGPARDVLAEQRALRLTLLDQPTTWGGLEGLFEDLLAAGQDDLAGEWLLWLERDLPLEHKTVETWVGVVGAWHRAGRVEVARDMLAWVHTAAPYRVDVARKRAELLLAADDEAGVVEMFEAAVRGVDAIQDKDEAIAAWYSTTQSPVREVAPSSFGFLDPQLLPVPRGYEYNPFGEVLASGDAYWIAGYGYGYGYGYGGDGGYGDGYEYGAGRGYGYGGGTGYGDGYGYGDGDGYGYGYGYGYGADGDPAARAKVVREGMRQDLRRAMIEIVVPRGMRYDGVTAYERMINEDPLDSTLVLEGWRYAALEGYGDRFEAYYRDVQQQANRDFRWMQLLATLDGYQGDLAGQAEWLEALLRIEPHRTDVHSRLVELYLCLDRVDEALEHLDRVRFLSSDEIGYHRQAADIAFARGLDDEGQRHLLQIRDLRPADGAQVGEVVRLLGDHGRHDAARAVARRFLDDTADLPADQAEDKRYERQQMIRDLMDAQLRAGDAPAARDTWWQAYGEMKLVDEVRWRTIYAAPGMLPTLRRDIESHQEELIADMTLRRAVEGHLRGEFLAREQAALTTLVLDADLLDQARKISQTYGNDGANRGSKLDPQLRRRLNALSGPDHRGVYRKIAWRPSGTPPGSLSADHARAVELLLRWERQQYAATAAPEALIREHGMVSTHPDVRAYADRYDRGHRALARFYAERHQYLDAVAELRQIELLFGPLYNDVYAEQLDLLASQIDAGFEVAEARRERERILAGALEAAVAEMSAWPQAMWAANVRDQALAGSALVRYLRHAAAADDVKAFGEAHEQLLRLTGVSGPYPDGASRDQTAWVERVVRTVDDAADQGSLELALDVRRRGSATLPDDISLQRQLLDVLAQRGERDVVMAEVERGIEATGRLWIHRWAVGYLDTRALDPEAALAFTERALLTFGGDLDLRLARIDLLVRTGDTGRAGQEVAYLVGGQTVGGYLQGQQIYAADAFDAPRDQTRTALGNHAIHGLTAAERERLFQVWAAATGDPRVLAYTVEQHPRDAAAYEAMARAALEGGHHTLALECLQKVRLLLPEDPARTWGLEGQIQWDAGRREEALTTWRKLAREPYPEAVQQAFDLLWERDMRAEAVALAASEVVRRRGFDPGGGGQGPSIVGYAVSRIEQTREYDLLGSLYRGVVPAVNNPYIAANYAAHLERVHRPDAAQVFLDDVIAGLPEESRLSVLHSIAAQAHHDQQYPREQEALGALITARPDEMAWRVLRVRALVMAGDPAALDAAVDALSANRISTGLQDHTAAPTVLQLLARGETRLDAAGADRLLAVLADERYAVQGQALVAPIAEIELAAGRPDVAVARLRETLDDHPEARQLWGAALGLLEARGAGEEACVLRGEQATHLLTYLPSDPDAMLIRARAAICDGRTQDGIDQAAATQRANPGSSTVVLDHARFLLEIDQGAAARTVAQQVSAADPLATEATLLAADAALAAGDPADAARSFVTLYGAALDDLRGPDDRVALAAWVAHEDHPERAAALLEALDLLGRQRSADPRPDRLVALLARTQDRPAAGETALRRALDKQPTDPGSVVQLTDLLLDQVSPPGAAVDEARRLVEDLYLLDPGRCDAGRLSFRVAAAAGESEAWKQALSVAGMSCAGVPDLLEAEQLLEQQRRYLEVIAVLERLEQVDPDQREVYEQRLGAAVAAHERAAREEVPR